MNKNSGAGSDYMSFTRLGYPSAFASEGNPSAGAFPGEFDPYVHTAKDTMDVDDDTGIFSLEVSVCEVVDAVLMLTGHSTWRDFQSWPLHSLSSRQAGTTNGGENRLYTCTSFHGLDEIHRRRN